MSTTELISQFKQNPQFLDFVINTAIDGLLFFNINYENDIWLNSTLWKSLGYIDEEDATSNWEKIAITKDIKKFLNDIEKEVVQKNYLIEKTIRFYHKNGAIVWMQCKASICKKSMNENRPPDIMMACKNITSLALETLDLQNTINRFGNISKGSELATWEYNMQTEEMMFNERWAKNGGYTLSELEPITKETWASLFHPKDLKNSYEIMEDYLSGKLPFFSCELRMKHKKGHWIWVYSKGKIISWTKDGKPEWVSGVHHNITKRKENELLLAHYKDLLERINDTAEIGVWEVDLTNNTVYWNPTIKKMVGVAEDFTPSLEDAIDFFAPGDNKEKLITAINGAINEGISYDVELQVITKGNRLKWCRTVGISEFENGKCTRLYGLFQDIDEKTRATLSLALREEELRKTFKNAAIGMALLDLESNCLRVNASLCNLLGYTREELLGTDISTYAHPRDKEICSPLILELLEGKREKFEIEKRYITKKGDVIWVYIGMSLILDQNNAPLQYIIQYTDITIQKQAEERVDKLLKVTNERNVRLVNFAHIVSHNLRSHSSNLSMLLDLIQIQIPNATENDFFPLLKNSVDNLQETIGHLNEVAVMSTKTIENLESLNLLDYIKKALNGVNALALESNCKTILEVDKNIKVMALPAYLDSLLHNFITNAIKYKSPSRNPEIKFTAQIKNDFVALNIQDNGLGIDLNLHRDKVFGMYKTFHEHDEARGIGLFITKNQIEAMGGKVDVISAVDAGSTFTTELKYDQN